MGPRRRISHTRPEPGLRGIKLDTSRVAAQSYPCELRSRLWIKACTTCERGVHHGHADGAQKTGRHAGPLDNDGRTCQLHQAFMGGPCKAGPCKPADINRLELVGAAARGQFLLDVSPKRRVAHVHQPPALPMAKPRPHNPDDQNNSQSCAQRDSPTALRTRRPQVRRHQRGKQDDNSSGQSHL
mgnify:CR=1 FL=1